MIKTFTRFRLMQWTIHYAGPHKIFVCDIFLVITPTVQFPMSSRQLCYATLAKLLVEWCTCPSEFVHRDLAARNILVSSNGTYKVREFRLYDLVELYVT